MTAFQHQFMGEINAHYGIIYNVVRSYCSCPENMKDMQQNILEQAWKSYPSFRGESRFSTWLHVIAVRTVVAEFRKERMQKKMIEIYAEQEARYTEWEPLVQLESCFKKGFGLLKSIDQEVIILYYLLKLGEDKVCRVLKLSPGILRMRVYRAKNKIRNAL